MNDDLSHLSLSELYDRLEPITAPPPIPLTPQTTGWVVLGVIVFAFVAIGIAHFLRRYRANAYRRAALVALSKAGDDPAAIAQILRRTAIATFPRAQVAGLHGENWLRFLDATSAKVTFAATDAGKALLAGPYKTVAPVPDLALLARRWVQTHSHDSVVP